MKLKPLFSSILLLLVITFIVGCSMQAKTENKGVPDTVILNCEEYLNFVNNYNSVDYQIWHNINTDTHIDYATLILNGKNRYTNTDCTVEYCFQYHKSDDLWTLIDSSFPSYSTSLNPDAFISDSPWQGIHNNTDSIPAFNNEYTYQIYIDNITDNYITLRYNFEFTNDRYDDIIQNNPIELPIQECNGFFAVIIDTSHLYTPFGDDFQFTLSSDGLWFQQR